MTAAAAPGDLRGARLADYVLAACLASWALGVLRGADDASRWTPVVVSLAVLHVLAAVLLAVRRPVAADGPAWTRVAALPSFATGAWALLAAPPPGEWTAAPRAAFAGAALFAAIALVRLGRSFAVLPAARPLVTSGPYAIVRHPALAGEIGMVVACAAASANAVLPLALCLPAAAARIAAEERMLEGVPGWTDYAARTRWRLVPWIW